MTAGLVRSVSMFTLAPVRTSADLAAGDGVRALLWLPLVGAGLGGVAALPAVAIRHWAPHAHLLGAVLAVLLLALLTRGLHLDGLADTADGLGSRAPAERALQIMRQSDIGPFGVLAIGLVLLADIAALDGLRGNDWAPVVVLAVAAATGRVAAVHAALRGIPTAHTSGFGALVGGGVAPAVAAVWTVVALGAGALAALAADLPIGWVVGPQVVALILAGAFRWHVVRRLGGTTGDVFGALIELANAATLIGVALA
jgi:adenosylcobinamide-GDP ribazoletransferase